MRYRLRTLLILLAILPPLLAAGYFLWVSRHTPPTRPKGPIIYQAKFVGNRRHADVEFIRKIGLRAGLRLNPNSAEQARKKIIELYHRDGCPQVNVRLLEGGKVGDKTLAFQINEGNSGEPTER
jgi:hypothetical protein